MAFEATKNNICILLRDAFEIMTDGPDDSDRHRADDKLGEAIALARIVCRDDSAIQSNKPSTGTEHKEGAE